MPQNQFVGPAAEFYDATSPEMFEPALLNATADFLAGEARGGPALEFWDPPEHQVLSYWCILGWDRDGEAHRSSYKRIDRTVQSDVLHCRSRVNIDMRT
jgi:hypothetical protein